MNSSVERCPRAHRGHYRHTGRGEDTAPLPLAALAGCGVLTARSLKAARYYATLLCMSMLARFHADWRSCRCCHCQTKIVDDMPEFDFTRDQCAACFVRNDASHLFSVERISLKFTGNWGASSSNQRLIAVDAGAAAPQPKGFENTGWRKKMAEATVIAGNDWRQLATNLFREPFRKPRTWILLPGIPADRLLFVTKMACLVSCRCATSPRCDRGSQIYRRGNA